jgi:hypothetical protein
LSFRAQRGISLWAGRDHARWRCAEDAVRARFLAALGMTRAETKSLNLYVARLSGLGGVRCQDLGRCEIWAEKGRNIPARVFYMDLTWQEQPSIPQERISFIRQFQREDGLIPLVVVRLLWVVLTPGWKLPPRDFTDSQF